MLPFLGVEKLQLCYSAQSFLPCRLRIDTRLSAFFGRAWDEAGWQMTEQFPLKKHCRAHTPVSQIVPLFFSLCSYIHTHMHTHTHTHTHMHTHAHAHAHMHRGALKRAQLLLSMKHGMARLDNVWGIGGGQRPVMFLVSKVSHVQGWQSDGTLCTLFQPLMFSISMRCKSALPKAMNYLLFLEAS